MFFGLPAMLIFGLLQVNWQGGTPQLTINSQKAAELRDVARNKLQNLDTQGHLQTIENNARQVWNNAQSQISQTGQGSNPFATNPQQNNPFGNGQFGSGQFGNGQVAGGQTTAVQAGGVQPSQAAFPSTRPRLTNAPLDYSRTPQTNATTTTPSQLANANTGLTQQQLQQQQLQQRQLQEQQLYQQQLYQQQLYERQLYEQQLYQQQLYQQQLYQQQLYEQQLRQQQQQAQNQWQPQTQSSWQPQAQTQNPWQPQATNPWQSQSQTPWQPQSNQSSSSQQTYAPQFDQFGRPFTSSNTNLTPNYTQQSAFPSNNSGRY
jgi:hypothetical protein